MTHNQSWVSDDEDTDDSQMYNNTASFGLTLKLLTVEYSILMPEDLGLNLSRVNICFLFHLALCHIKTRTHEISV